ncbi:tRNA U-34 5-methylaminomethyl-2-thiouridine biosynthesis protein [Achromobacter denitrificans]|jgi:2-aminophenol/2-amino-5-chlorophenol 1,6-dioxygenase alpha subunit|uniref:DODA-type extradiol aromatic ring-opening family dioxygenase n=1 Tax=Achromobacter denitrificans TaxID=32002 RepID=UPI0023E76B9E|nr:tRNA U-34 5-methylaminomethyl-2-thiouridine biosynthesis protein [Achromobacter denitrificans]MDF3848526.1 tRNA U-34 5-methylaminomethyl-2-thiouridine biosynthesis protein [Achromobacter denitrificans]
MSIVSAFLVPGNPLPQLRPDIAPWGRIQAALRVAGEALAASRPDCVLVYSTQWMAVLDQLWITRERSVGLHVDENWHEFGEQPFDIASDTALAQACVARCLDAGVRARGVDYDGFPIDTGTITASTLMGFGQPALPVVIAANNLYHDAARTETLARLAVDCASAQGKRVAVVGVGGLSHSLFREPLALEADRLHSASDDDWNRRLLALMEAGDAQGLRDMLPDFARQARADMGMKHLHWVLGALGDALPAATVHAYEPLYGSGAAVVEFGRA